MSQHTALALSLADRLGVELLSLLEPATLQAVVVGSVRRRMPEVHDVEIVAMPLVGGPQSDLFGTLRPSDFSLGDYLRDRTGSPTAHWKVVAGKTASKRLQLRHQRTETMGEIYVVEEARAWGPHVVVRTGPRGFGVNLMTRARSQGKFFADGFLLHAHPATESGCARGRDCPYILDLSTEPSVFEALAMKWVAPEDRR